MGWTSGQISGQWEGLIQIYWPIRGLDTDLTPRCCLRKGGNYLSYLFHFRQRSGFPCYHFPLSPVCELKSLYFGRRKWVNNNNVKIYFGAFLALNKQSQSKHQSTFRFLNQLECRSPTPFWFNFENLTQFIFHSIRDFSRVFDHQKTIEKCRGRMEFLNQYKIILCAELFVKLL